MALTDKGLCYWVQLKSVLFVVDAVLIAVWTVNVAATTANRIQFYDGQWRCNDDQRSSVNTALFSSTTDAVSQLQHEMLW